MSSSAVVALSPMRDGSPFSPIRFDGSGSPHCSSESILIYLVVPGSSVIPMQVFESDSIASVKLRIQSFKGFVIKKQKLVFDGRELARNDSLVRDYGVADGNVMHLVIRLSDLRCITVETICGKKYNFQIERSRNIGYIKQQLAKKGNNFSDLLNHKLVCDGEELDDQRVIDDICKNNDAVIHLLICKSAKVRTKPVEKDFELSIDAPDVTKKKEVDDLQIIARKQPCRDSLVEPVIVNPKVELSPMIAKLVQSASSGLEAGNLPIISSEGSGGAYFMQDALGQNYVAVFKPIDEEPMAENNPRGLPLSTDGEGLKRGTRVGEGAMREVAAYILDHPIGRHRLSDEAGFAGVPPTIMVRCFSSNFHHPQVYGYAAENFKIGSLQKFVKNNGSCEDMGPRAFPVDEVHKISVLDIRLANADRHAGNILVYKEEEGRIILIPIDHGYCLPENFEDCTFEWLYWPQARQPFSDTATDYIKSLDAEEDIALLKFHGWKLSPECSRTLRISTMLLKKGAERGLTPYDIGSIMCRETIKKESKIEEIIREAKNAVLPGVSETAFLESISEIIDSYLDKL
ncbi:phosphatidylinositol 4-kinase gamma 4-like [Canna indica]|uniref:1-phosphatidylinositol 4-kinase n=1 Tax=Canna indica TaxID=4628 RepID=A0AAQ3QHF7_9LILI|nr:phosphatidylinositol 4-kinase gamma 4-like [Canna indica]